MNTWKLTKRGEVVLSIVEGIASFVLVYGGAWLMWALLNTLFTGGQG